MVYSVYEEFEETKGIIEIPKLKKNRKEKVQNDKQQSTKHTHKTKYQVA